MIVPPFNLAYPPAVATIPPTAPAFITTLLLAEDNIASEPAPLAKAPIPFIVTAPFSSAFPPASAKAPIFLNLLASETVFLSSAFTAPFTVTTPLFLA